MPEVCQVHEQEVETIHKLASDFEGVATDVRWIRKIGNFTVMAILAMLPFLVGVCVYLAKLDNRVSLLEYQVNSHLKGQK